MAYTVRSMSDDGWEKLNLTTESEQAARLVWREALTYPGDVVTLERGGVVLERRQDERAAPVESADVL